MTIRLEVAHGAARDRAVSTALSVIRRGGIVVAPMESQYAVVTDAFSPVGTRKIRQFKKVESHVPLTVLVPSSQTVAGITQYRPPYAQDLMESFWPGSLTLLLMAGNTLAWDHPKGVPVSVRMPLHPVALSLLTACGPLASSAANRAGSIPASTSDDLDECDGNDVDLILDGGDLRPGMMSTVVDCTGATPNILREGSVTVAELQQIVPNLTSE